MGINNISIVADHDYDHQIIKASSSPITVPNSYTTTSPYNSHPSSTSTSPTSSAAAAVPVVMSPCAACKILRRRCVEKCVLAPYFPPTDPLKFTIAHRVFGASNIIKFLQQELPESQRADAVSSMVYEANARIRDPVYGCAGAICQLQNQISELQAELAKAQAEVVNMQSQQANLVALIYMEMAQTTSSSPHQEIAPAVFFPSQPQQLQIQSMDTSCFLDDSNLGASWDPLWT
ncbi:LOB domain-containing protein 1 [Linum perenne]